MDIKACPRFDQPGQAFFLPIEENFPQKQPAQRFERRSCQGVGVIFAGITNIKKIEIMGKKGMFYRFLVLAFVIGGLSGCVKSGSNYTSNNNAVTFLTVMNLTSSSVDIYFNGTKASPNGVAAGFFDQRYEQLAPGAYDIQFKALGKDSLLAGVPASLYDSLDFSTLILYNNAGSTAANAVKIVDDYSTISQTAANYRFFNMCPDAPAIDLYIGSTKSQLSRTTADNVTNTGYNAFQPVTPGTYDIVAKKAGSDSVVATASGITMTAQTASTIFLQGYSGNSTNPVSLKVLVASY
jgi:hypothetical protein